MIKTATSVTILKTRAKERVAELQCHRQHEITAVDGKTSVCSSASQRLNGWQVNGRNTNKREAGINVLTDIHTA
jgi:hypothetical protein